MLARARALWARLPRAWQLALAAGLASRLLLLTVAWLDHAPYKELPADASVYRGGAPHALGLVDAFQRWDAYWYLSIARDGYRPPALDAPEILSSNIAFFPLFPLAMRALGPLFGGDLALGGLLLSWLAFFASLAALHRLLSLDLDEPAAELGVWLFALQPWSFAFSAIYTEGLFFLLSVLAMLHARGGRLAVAATCGLLSGLCRLPGCLLVLPIGLEWLARRPRRPRDLALLCAIPLGTLGYLLYLWRLTGVPDAFFRSQRPWANNLVLGTKLLRWMITGRPERDQLLTLIACAALVAVAWRRVRTSYFVYLVASIALTVSAGMLTPARHVAAAFPVYAALACFCAGHRTRERALLGACAFGSAAVYWLWLTWRHVF